MKLPFGLDKLFNNYNEDDTTLTKKSTTITEELKTPITPTPVTDKPLSEEDNYMGSEDEIFDTLQTVLENQFVDRDKVDSLIHLAQSNSTMLSTLIKLLSTGSGGLGVLGVSAEDVTDMKIVISLQRKIVTGLLTIPVLDAVAREAISQKLVEMPEWEQLEAAEKRLKEREYNRNTLKDLQKDADEQV